MTKQEYQAWLQETQKSQHQWRFDPIAQHNRKEILAYIGGENGQYVSIKNDGTLSVGTYEGAIPHIGEAAFQQKFAHKYEDAGKALEAAVNAAGLTFLRDMFMA